MELDEVLRRRRMVRHYDDRPLDPEVVERVVAAGLRAPSAGFSQGYAVLLLTDADDRRRFWSATETPQETASWPPETRAGVMRAPALAVALSCKRAYLDRYARDDKGWTDRDEGRWPVPFWHVDTGMVALLMLLKAVDEGLGALFIGMAPAVIPAFRAEFGVPDDHDVVGVVCFGHEAVDAPRRDLRGKRLAAEQIVHRGRW
ncbi:MAG TPA: nitroreductase family protein [Mycobacteriales bacterium]|jgi:nitroreductase|nr:nitroreductase family protein [Mycobacteriales bacterium]